MNIIGIAILIGVGVFLSAAFVGLLHALGVACVVIGVILFFVWLVAGINSRGGVRF